MQDPETIVTLLSVEYEKRWYIDNASYQLENDKLFKYGYYQNFKDFFIDFTVFRLDAALQALRE